MAKSKPEKDDDGYENEFERRWLVRTIDPKVRKRPSQLFEQAYFDKTRDLRVRIIDGKKAILANKIGRGVARKEKPHPTPLSTGRFLHDSTPYVIRKRRHLIDGWEVDFFEGPLSGLVLAEFEMKSEQQIIIIPKWMKDSVEVTDTLSNRLLAHIAYDLSCEADGERRPIKDYLPKKVPSIVLTGGPCSGKTTIMALLRAEFGNLLHCVPETATIIIDSVGAKPPIDDPIAMRDFQRTIYRVQHSFEKASHRQADRDTKAALLLDRGTVDGAAYMPRGLSDLERICDTTIVEEYARYDGVICLEVVPSLDVYNAKTAEHPTRSEDHKKARELGERIHRVWSNHPNFHYIRATSFEEKVAATRAALLKCIERAAKK